MVAGADDVNDSRFMVPVCLRCSDVARKIFSGSYWMMGHKGLLTSRRRRMMELKELKNFAQQHLVWESFELTGQKKTTLVHILETVLPEVV